MIIARVNESSLIACTNLVCPHVRKKGGKKRDKKKKKNLVTNLSCTLPAPYSIKTRILSFWGDLINEVRSVQYNMIQV